MRVGNFTDEIARDRDLMLELYQKGLGFGIESHSEALDYRTHGWVEVLVHEMHDDLDLTFPLLNDVNHVESLNASSALDSSHQFLFLLFTQRG